MWDFDIGRSVSIMMRTWPFIVFRMIVYFGITLAYIMATGTGASVGYGVGHISTDPDGPLSFAMWGGVVGFGIVSIAVYWIREYILYVVKAGHIAVMVHLIDGHDVPDGQNQIAYAKEIVTERFAEANILFVVDQLVKGAIRAITGLLGGIAAFLPIPGLSGLVSVPQHCDSPVADLCRRDHSWLQHPHQFVLAVRNRAPRRRALRPER
ncbi:putative membrane protein [Mesorhizobium sp. URHB0026]